ncbi:uncharacterized protein N7529_003474 [Penicillium soppii]|uniref:uncharacterized protein n=1 Tax=Penicillium soppii TaxID=69789 RepID=UPI002548CACB|nr:uncharacterized protein N7529_003474 [Penicillium soppii]KAJ5871121.1 hypothetical protein N7529_003474 [Penicillium soppii]
MLKPTKMTAVAKETIKETERLSITTEIQITHGHREPSTSLEGALKHLLGSILGLSPGQIGADDDFFQLGGDSLRAMHLVAQARSIWMSADISSAWFFESPTIRALAQRLELSSRLLPGSGPSLRPLTSSSQVNPFQANELLNSCGLQKSDLEGGLIRATSFQSKALGFKCTHLVYELGQSVDYTLLEKAWALVREKYAALRTVYVCHQGQAYQGFLKEVDRRIPVHSTEPLALDDYVHQFCEEAAQQVIPDGAPHFGLTRISTTAKNLLVVQINHSLYDTISMKRIFQELAAAYSGSLDPRDQRDDFPEYMQLRVDHNRGQEVVAFWKRYLHGAHMTRTCFSSPGAVESEVKMVFGMMPSPKIVPRPGVTAASVLRAATALVLSQLTGNDDVVFGEIVHGRDLRLPDTDKIVGCTIAEVPTRVMIPRGGTVQDLLRHSLQQHVRRIPYETLDIEDIIRMATSWPLDTKFGVILVVESPDAYPRMNLDGQESTPKPFFHGLLHDVHIQLNLDQDTPSLMVLGPSSLISLDMANILAKKLVICMEQLNSTSEKPLASVQM